MSEELKPCPFCGSHDVEICRTNENACWVRCSICGADSESHKTRKKAFSNWNRRFYDDIAATIISDDDKEWNARYTPQAAE